MTLTDADRAAIERIYLNGIDCVYPRQLIEAGYRAGLAAGIERAAKVCDHESEVLHAARLPLAYGNIAIDCAAAVRALAASGAKG